MPCKSLAAGLVATLAMAASAVPAPAATPPPRLDRARWESVARDLVPVARSRQVPLVVTSRDGAGHLRFTEVQASTPQEVAAAVDRQAAGGAVLAVELDQRTRLAERVLGPTPPQPRPTDQWALARLGARESWKVTTGAGVTVAVIDSGVHVKNPGFAPATFVAGRDLYRAGLVDRPGGTSADIEHGTHVAGIVASRPTGAGIGTSGLAPGARIMPIRIVDELGEVWASDVARGISWAADHGARVMNLSLGFTQPTMSLQLAVQDAQRQGAVVVASAGNEGPATMREWPAAFPGVVAVGATRRDDRLARFSTHSPQLAVAAPGDGILSTFGKGWREESGTSMASPYVAAEAALLRSRHPGWTPAQTVDRIERTADDRGPAGRDDQYGFGVIDPAAALGQAFKPDFPTGAPANVRVRIEGNSALLTWDAPAGGNVAGYALLDDGDPSGGQLREQVRGTSMRIPRDPERLWAIAASVVAVSPSGLWGPQSPTITILFPPVVLAPPTNVRARVADGVVYLDWDRSTSRDVHGYLILRDGILIGVAQATQFDDSDGLAGVRNGARHTYSVMSASDPFTPPGDPVSIAATPRRYAPLTDPATWVSRFGGRLVGHPLSTHDEQALRAQMDARMPVASVALQSLRDQAAGPAGLAFRGFAAALGRSPQAAELGAVGSGGRIGLAGIIYQLAQSPEFTGRWGGVGDAALVAGMYHQVLGRVADRGALAYWTHRLAVHTITRPGLVAQLADSAEGRARLADPTVDYLAQLRLLATVPKLKDLMSGFGPSNIVVGQIVYSRRFTDSLLHPGPVAP